MKTGEKWIVMPSKSAIATFVNGDVKSLFPQTRKMVLFGALVENNGKRKGNGLTSFKQKGVRRTVVTRADIGVNPANEILDKERGWWGVLGDAEQAASTGGR